jgi:hypothetical protein
LERRDRKGTAPRRARSVGSAASAPSRLSSAEVNEIVAMSYLSHNIPYEYRIAWKDSQRIPQMSDLCR